ncbi:cation:dicarboxylase symporter family transporter, partial [Planococcus sp. SIMBA_143]
ALVGILTATVFDLSAEQIEAGQAESERGSMLEDRLGDVEAQSTPDKILHFIPSNIFLDMTGERSTSVIAVVIFSLIVGIAVLGVRRKNPEQAEMFTKIVNSLYAVVMRIVTASDVVSEGEKLKVEVLSVDMDNERISLSHKNTIPGPWSDIESRFSA